MHVNDIDIDAWQPLTDSDAALWRTLGLEKGMELGPDGVQGWCAYLSEGRTAYVTYWMGPSVITLLILGRDGSATLKGDFIELLALRRNIQLRDRARARST